MVEKDGRAQNTAALTVRCPVLLRHMEPQSCRDEFKLLFLVDLVCVCVCALPVLMPSVCISVLVCAAQRGGGVNAP